MRYLIVAWIAMFGLFAYGQSANESDQLRAQLADLDARYDQNVAEIAALSASLDSGVQNRAGACAEMRRAMDGILDVQLNAAARVTNVSDFKTISTLASESSELCDREDVETSFREILRQALYNMTMDRRLIQVGGQEEEVFRLGYFAAVGADSEFIRPEIDGPVLSRNFDDSEFQLMSRSRGDIVSIRLPLSSSSAGVPDDSARRVWAILIIEKIINRFRVESGFSSAQE